jgi:hypothetical protein
LAWSVFTSACSLATPVILRPISVERLIVVALIPIGIATEMSDISLVTGQREVSSCE